MNIPIDRWTSKTVLAVRFFLPPINADELRD